MGGGPQRIEAFQADEILPPCADSFSPRRPPQVRDQNLHKSNGEDDEDNILAPYQAYKAPKIVSEEGYDLTNYPPSFGSEVSQATVKGAERANPIMALMKAGPTVPAAVSGNRMLLTEDNKKLFDMADGYRSIGNWVDGIPAPGFVARKEMHESFIKHRGSSLATDSNYGDDFVPVENASEDHLLFGIGLRFDEPRRVVSDLDDFVVVENEDAYAYNFNFESADG